MKRLFKVQGSEFKVQGPEIRNLEPGTWNLKRAAGAWALGFVLEIGRAHV